MNYLRVVWRTGCVTVASAKQGLNKLYHNATRIYIAQDVADAALNFFLFNWGETQTKCMQEDLT